jgi:aryl-alcohol dehydrogenase-like predicted oxidoreductase
MYKQRYWYDTQFDAIEAMDQFFAPRERSLTQVAVAWVLSRPGITSAIVGASRAEQLKDTLPAAAIEFTSEETAFLDRLGTQG